MLSYLGYGQRTYADPAAVLSRRGRWEFQAVVAGSLSVVNQIAEILPPKRRTLWVFPPDDQHGWYTGPDRTCRIAVAHFERVPDAVREAAGRGRLTKSLSPEQCRTVERLIVGLTGDYEHPTNLSALRVERGLLELSLIALSDEPEQRVDPTPRKVDQALSWYAEHMGERPSISRVARAVFVSQSHLRRLFARAGMASPLTEMRRVQIDRATQLVSSTDLSMSEIAEACGFQSLSDFSRVFKRITGNPPRLVRKRSRENPVAASGQAR